VQQGPALLAAQALLERGQIDQASVEGLSEADLGRVQRHLVDANGTLPFRRRPMGPDRPRVRTLSGTETSSRLGTVGQVVLVLVIIVVVRV
jgi:hypothetical protein